jgi:regulator of sirC expression with transglutaminase-like and TPR domain
METFTLLGLSSIFKEFNHHFGYNTDPEKKIRALNSFLYQKGYWNDSITFDYDYDDLQGLNRDNRFINGYLARKKGTCVTMPMLYLILAERLKMPMYAVRAPNHFFVRYFPGESSLNWQANVEATSGGGYSPDEAYVLDMQIPKRGIETGMYLRTLRKKEYLASLLLLNVAEYMEIKQFDKAQQYSELAMKYDSTLATALWAYGLVHYKRALDLRDKMDSEIQTETAMANIVARSHSSAEPMRNKQSTSPNVPGPTIAAGDEFRKYAAGLIPELPAPKSQQVDQPPTHADEYRPSMSPELHMEIQMIQDRYLPLINKNLEVWYAYKQKAKDRGIALGPQTKFFLKQSNKLKQYKTKGDK